jgi:hypothetical protein
LYSGLSEAIGKGDTDLLYSGFMAAPEMTEGLAESLLRSDRKGDYGLRRFNIFNEERLKTPDFLSVK